ncbi:MAG: hypothetical protein K1X56_06250 [Flavobacteriales bacterium]|nr:hypothetical protein [Flavobacteriales bacterium]
MKWNVLTIVLLSVFIASCSQEEVVVKNEVPKKDSIAVLPPLVKSPVPEFNPPLQKLELVAETGAELFVEGSKGSKIIVPANVLVDSLRRPIKGKVTFHYREFHDAASVYCAGIPMDYDAAGILKRFETAGMFELRAEQNGNTVYVDSGKTISVQLASMVGGNDYHFFYLDEQGTRNWHYMGDEGGAPNPEKEKLKKKKYGSALKIPLGPEYFSFNYMAALDVMMNDNYSLINKNRNDAGTKSRIKDYGLNWSNIYNYQSITFEGKKYLASMLVWKNLTGVPFPDWAGKAESVLTQVYGNVYEIVIDDKAGHFYKGKIEAVMSLKSLFAFSASQWKSKYEETLAKVKADEKRMNELADVYRTMEINQFGIYNYDRFLNDENAVSVHADFKFDRDAGILQNQEVCYVSSSNRSLVKFPYEKWNNVVLIPDPGAKLFAVLPGNYVAVFSSKKYKQLDFRQMKYRSPVSMSFEMTSIRPFKGADDLLSILQEH